jgi:hypothetical protein
MALTADVTSCRYGTLEAHQPIAQPLGANVTVYANSIALTDSSGNIKNASSPASTDHCWGLVAEQRPFPPNPTSSVAGTYNVEIDTGSFFLASGTGGDALTQANVGQSVYVINETTVGATNGSNTRPLAGTMMYYDSTATSRGGQGPIAVKFSPGGP